MNGFQLVHSGQVGMWFDLGTRIVMIGGPEPNFTTAIAPPPIGTSSATAGDIQVSGLYISSQTQQREACWAWLKHLSGELSVLESGDFPARRSLAESTAFQSQSLPGAAEVYKAYSAALDRELTPAELARDTRAIDFFWFARAIDRALQGEDLERELVDAEKFTRAYLDCVRNDGKPATCASQVDPNYKGFAGGIGE